VIAGYNDSRVQYWEAAKWVAKLRATKTDDNLLLLKTELGAGHGGMSGRYQGLRDVALEYAFVFKVWGSPEELGPTNRSQDQHTRARYNEDPLGSSLPQGMGEI
jgi:hypothetical protein